MLLSVHILASVLFCTKWWLAYLGSCLKSYKVSNFFLFILVPLKGKIGLQTPGPVLYCVIQCAQVPTEQQWLPSENTEICRYNCLHKDPGPLGSYLKGKLAISHQRIQFLFFYMMGYQFSSIWGHNQSNWFFTFIPMDFIQEQ